MSPSNFTAVPASQFNFEQLAEIYNESRVDYIVPMPMNARRMSEYVYQYDVDLAASVVAVNTDQQIAGVGMLGLRGERAWITRLGVIPSRRGRGIGQFIMEALLASAIARGCTQVQLEVIEGNEPAYCLFQKLGFVETRHLLVIRRPPGRTGPLIAGTSTQPLASHEVLDCLNRRIDAPSWLDETPSILYNNGMEGLRVITPEDDWGWVVLRPTVFQLSHFIFGIDRGSMSHDLAVALITAIHDRYPRRDTKIENIPSTSPLLDAYQQMGYAHEFGRIEMIKPL